MARKGALPFNTKHGGSNGSTGCGRCLSKVLRGHFTCAAQQYKHTHVDCNSICVRSAGLVAKECTGKFKFKCAKCRKDQ